MRWGCCAGPETGEVLARAGYDYIELSVSRHLQPEVDDDGWRPLRQAIAAQPLAVEAFNTFLPSDLKVVGPAVDETRIRRYLEVAFERAADLGGQVVVFGSGGARAIPEGFPRERAWGQLIDFARRAGDKASKVGMAVCIEPLNRSECNVLNDLEEAVRLARGVDHPDVSVLADLYHMVREDEPIGRLVEVGDWIFHVHVADTDRRAPGLGSYPYPAFFSALHQIHYDARCRIGRCSIECRWEDLAGQCGPALEFLLRTWGDSAP
jgi:sugar phosphate isomerase/epimerase